MKILVFPGKVANGFQDCKITLVIGSSSVGELVLPSHLNGWIDGLGGMGVS